MLENPQEYLALTMNDILTAKSLVSSSRVVFAVFHGVVLQF